MVTSYSFPHCVHDIRHVRQMKHILQVFEDDICWAILGQGAIHLAMWTLVVVCKQFDITEKVTLMIA